MRAPSLSWRSAWPLLFTLNACSGTLDLGHDLGPGLTPPASRTSASCDGAPCFGGKIQYMADSPGNAKGLSLDATKVYWAATTAFALMITPREGGNTQRIGVPPDGPYGVAVGDVDIYFTSRMGGYVASTYKNPPPPAPHPIDLANIHMLANDQPQPESVLVTRDYVYFADQLAGAVKRVILNSGAPGTPETIASGIDSGGALALDEQRLYYSDSGLGEIHAVELQSLQNTLLLSGLAHPGGVLARGDDLYFLERGTTAAGYADGRLARMPRAGGNVEVLLENLDAPAGLAADSSAVYVCTGGTAQNKYRGRIVRRADSGQISTLATDQAQPFAIAVDDLAVYWTADGDNALRALRR